MLKGSLIELFFDLLSRTNSLDEDMFSFQKCSSATESSQVILRVKAEEAYSMG